MIVHRFTANGGQQGSAAGVGNVLEMKWFETGCLAAVMVIVAACTSTGETEISRTVAGFVGRPREAAIARLGRPNKVIIENGETESYWLKVDVETYAGLSNRREVRTVDGQAQISETEGMKIKEHRRDCIIKITADAASTIKTSEIIGNPANCEDLLSRPAS
ncbi:hypothetical protein CFBP5877_23925 [Agrobacterium tumefaciens]|uniref:Uncharacterized protein n=2 Tax=Rhizobium/Agrobacterium group TaxID=227290 RepID=A0AAE6EHZ0_AGRTU|nr:hypothetical protein CFBP5499_24670 [Agrobacterium tumefaciens]QCL82101.1 hypothetical protein CFBP5877_23925 [Agrobacterium tumefaciens]CUX66078.1 conserved hypothetical protein [Agrobacterium sp. NCPPB 925]